MPPGRAAGATAGRPAADEGMVTAELAVALPTLVVVLVAALAAVAAMGTQLRCIDAAASAARLAARGESHEAAAAAVAAIASTSARLAISTSRDQVTVVVDAPVTMPGLSHLLRLPSVSARVTEPVEPGALG
jgi:Flp pilus assembly protein TadG